MRDFITNREDGKIVHDEFKLLSLAVDDVIFKIFKNLIVDLDNRRMYRGR